MRYARYMSLGLVLLLFVAVGGGAQPSHAFNQGQILLSGSTFVYLADPETRKLDEYNFAYLPAGTLLRYEGEVERKWGYKRYLIHAETGAYGYIREDQMWDRSGLKGLTGSGMLGIFQRKYVHAGSVKDVLNFQLTFTRGEKYEVLDREADAWVITVDLYDKFVDDEGKPLIELTEGTSVTLRIKVPTDYLQVLDFAELEGSGSPARATEEPNSSPSDFETSAGELFPPTFKKSIIDGIAGLEKPCNTKKSRLMRTSVGGGFNVEKFFAKLGFSAERETEEIEVFPESKNVTRTYYARKGNVVYRLTKYKDCSTGHFEFSFLKPGNDEVPVTNTWAKQNGLKIDHATGKVMVTCPPQYFAFENALVDQGFDRSEASFLISKVGRWKNLSDASCS